MDDEKKRGEKGFIDIPLKIGESQSYVKKRYRWDIKVPGFTYSDQGSEVVDEGMFVHSIDAV